MDIWGWTIDEIHGWNNDTEALGVAHEYLGIDREARRLPHATL
jgi:hypothetical protein